MKQHALWLGPVLASLLYFLLLQRGLEYKTAITAAIALVTIIWWVTEALPIPVTSLVPFALLPLFGVLNHRIVSEALGSHVILLLMGAFMLSKALEKSGVHRRLALGMLHLFGTNSQKKLVFGFMFTTAMLSMWISNTATVLIMLPIALAVLTHSKNRALVVALILGVAYSASVGGLGTLIGTPPNVIFAAIYEIETGSEFSFLSWMLIGVPCVLVIIPLMAFWLTRHLSGSFDGELPVLGKWQVQEKRTLIVFAIAVLAWITRTAPFGGWSAWLDIPMAGDSTVALAAVVAMFMIPDGRKQRILDWQSAVSIPWGMLLLFAGGIALAKGFSESGLSDLIGQGLSGLANFPLVITLLFLCLAVTYLTEIISNTAAATLLMPILYLVAIEYGVDPAVLMIPAAMAASCAFMLPVATAPNAIVYGTDKIDIIDMVKEGAVLSFVVSILLGIMTYVLISVAL